MFNIGAFMGWVHAIGLTHPTPWRMLWSMYIGACMWTFTYETVYQHQVRFLLALRISKHHPQNQTCQDKRDDVRIGLNSPALLLGYSTKPICTITGLGFFGLFAYAGWLNGQGISFYLGLLCGAIMLFSKMIKTDVDVPNDCREFFLKTKPIGQVILTGLVVDAGVMTWVKSQ